MTDKLLYNTTEAAEYLNVSRAYLDHLRVAGGGPKYKEMPPAYGRKGKGRLIRYTKAALDEWVASIGDLENTTQAALRSA